MLGKLSGRKYLIYAYFYENLGMLNKNRAV
ncbi:hypothetical protein ABH902_001066 [Enterococcus sp. UD-01]|jgi:hypothetical protein